MADNVRGPIRWRADKMLGPIILGPIRCWADKIRADNVRADKVRADNVRADKMHTLSALSRAGNVGPIMSSARRIQGPIRFGGQPPHRPGACAIYVRHPWLERISVSGIELRNDRCLLSNIGASNVKLYILQRLFLGQSAMTKYDDQDGFVIDCQDVMEGTTDSDECFVHSVECKCLRVGCM